MPTPAIPAPFTNAHSHIFTARHAPDFFLKTVIHNKFFAVLVDKLLQKQGTRTLLGGVNWIFKLFSPNYRHIVERYIEFVQIGTSATQQEVFDKEAVAYSRLGNYRIVALTQVLDFLDYDGTSGHRTIQTQVQEVLSLKRNVLYHDRLIPFLGIDPRMQGVNLVDWLQQYINKDTGFYGIKIYPAYGYFPFDIRLDPVWKWASDNNIPVMTHCTRGGSFYLGSFDSLLNRGGFTPVGINPSSPAMAAITKRINALVSDPSKTLRKNNKVWCNIFGHPENYKPVLEKYPGLKICLAHLGGADEVNRTVPASASHKVEPQDYPDYLLPNWYTLVKNLMQRFDNVYSDISYTLSDPYAIPVILNDFRGTDLIKRLMYGTDFYLTQQEEKGDEPSLINIFLQSFSAQDEIQQLGYDNPDKFLKSAIFP
jgi:predicted TIM-barrel fold metal-dependent hydrolase